MAIQRRTRAAKPPPSPAKDKTPPAEQTEKAPPVFQGDVAPGIAQGDTPIRLRLLRIESDFRQQTRTLPRQERERFDSLLWNSLRMDWGPKTTIAQVVGADQNASVGYEQEDALKSTVDYYSKKVDRRDLLRVLRFY